MSTSSEAYAIIKENGTQKKIIDKLIFALKQLRRATTAEMIDFIDDFFG